MPKVSHGTIYVGLCTTIDYKFKNLLVQHYIRNQGQDLYAFACFILNSPKISQVNYKFELQPIDTKYHVLYCIYCHFLTFTPYFLYFTIFHCIQIINGYYYIRFITYTVYMYNLYNISYLYNYMVFNIFSCIYNSWTICFLSYYISMYNQWQYYNGHRLCVYKIN